MDYRHGLQESVRFLIIIYFEYCPPQDTGEIDFCLKDQWK